MCWLVRFKTFAYSNKRANKQTNGRTNERTNTQTNTIYYDDVEQRVYSSQTNYSRFAMVRVNQNYVACSFWDSLSNLIFSLSCEPWLGRKLLRCVHTDWLYRPVCVGPDGRLITGTLLYSIEGLCKQSAESTEMSHIYVKKTNGRTNDHC